MELPKVPASYRQLIKYQEYEEIRAQQAQELLSNTHWDKFKSLLAEYYPPDRADLTLVPKDWVSIKASEEQNENFREEVRPLFEELIPWRKGPFNIFGMEIDSEWRSDLKWNRLESYLAGLKGKRVLDVGCNNGYYMYRMLEQDPDFVLGLDPSSRCYFQFMLLQHIYPESRLAFDLLGIEHISVFPEFFDTVLCLGVIYHRRDPYECCRLLYDCLKPGGQVLLETLVIPGDEPTALVPKDRYAQMRNVWWVPTVNSTHIWLEKAGFTELKTVDISPTTLEEQRKTDWAPYDSLEDFLDPKDPEKTIEGYPAPLRATISAWKPRANG